MIMLAHLIQYGGVEGENADEMSLIVLILASSLMSGKAMPPSTSKRDDVVVEAGWIFLFCQMRDRRSLLICCI
jgi:hypothetical protein